MGYTTKIKSMTSINISILEMSLAPCLSICGWKYTSRTLPGAFHTMLKPSWQKKLMYEKKNPASRDNVVRSLHKLPKNDCFETRISKISLSPWQKLLMKKNSLCAHRAATARKNVSSCSLHKTPQNDCFETWTIKINIFYTKHRRSTTRAII